MTDLEVYNMIERIWVDSPDHTPFKSIILDTSTPNLIQYANYAKDEWNGQFPNDFSGICNELNMRTDVPTELKLKYLLLMNS